MTTAVSIGDRVLIAKQKATVRYVGAVDGYEGSWVGVEWDDSSRGKHDGSTGGRKYFSCNSSSPTAGSLVKLSKVSQGNSLVDALALRYTNKLAEGQNTADGQAYVNTSKHRKVWVEVVGEEKVTERQSKLDLLLSARVVGAHITHVGTPGELSAAVPNLQQLDLTDNLIGSWSTVTSICQELPKLRLINLTQNRLNLPSSLTCCQQQQQLTGLQCLVLNQCALTWQQVGVLQTSLPHLVELHVAGNNISSLRLLQMEHEPDPDRQQQDHSSVDHCTAADVKLLCGFMNLQVLGLEDNSIRDWGEVLRLAGLPQLKRLQLSNNPITSIIYPQQQRLRELRLTGNPLLAAEGMAAGAGRRFEVIGRVAGLTLLNGADVKPRERRDCELRYLQYILAEQSPSSTAQQHQQQHPRLAELLSKYGQVSAVGAAKGAQQGSSLNSSTCEVLLKHGDSTLKKKLPKTITVAALKLLTSRLFKVQPDQQRLLLHDSNSADCHSEDIGADDTKTLGYWDVADKAIVEVLHIDTEEQRSAAHAAWLKQQGQQEQRIAQQLQQGDSLRNAAQQL
eukprot:gene4443-4698_t